MQLSSCGPTIHYGTLWECGLQAGGKWYNRISYLKIPFMVNGENDAKPDLEGEELRIIYTISSCCPTLLVCNL